MTSIHSLSGNLTEGRIRMEKSSRVQPESGVVYPLLLACLFLVAPGCVSSARFVPPAEFDEAALRAAAETISEDGIRVSASIPDHATSASLLGVDLSTMGIQPLWLEIENNTDRRLFFLPTGLDPEYFSPMEVAFGFKSQFSRDSYPLLDEHIESMGLRYTVEPYSTESGFLFTNTDSGSKFVTVDLVGEKWSKSLSLVVSNPDHDDSSYQRIVELLKNPEVTEVADLTTLRRMLEQLPCCTSKVEDSGSLPLNLVIVGKLEDMSAAFIRRNYRVYPTPVMHALGRDTDVAISKQDRWVPSQPTVVRIWLTSIRFEGNPVWVAQVSMPRGGRFAKSHGSRSSGPVDPDLDAARAHVIQDIIFSQSLSRLGFVKGAERVESKDDDVFTDGLRAVLFIDRTPIGIAEVQILEWEKLANPGSALN
jgi:hypothetical protein